MGVSSGTLPVGAAQVERLPVLDALGEKRDDPIFRCPHIVESAYSPALDERQPWIVPLHNASGEKYVLEARIGIVRQGASGEIGAIGMTDETRLPIGRTDKK